MGYTTELQRQKMVLNFFSLRNVESFHLNFALSVFLYDFISNKARKLKLQSRISLWKIFLALSLSISFSLSLSLCVCVSVGWLLRFLSFSFSLTFYLAHYLSLLYSFVNAALQLLFCDVIVFYPHLTARQLG